MAMSHDQINLRGIFGLRYRNKTERRRQCRHEFLSKPGDDTGQAHSTLTQVAFFGHNYPQTGTGIEFVLQFDGQCPSDAPCPEIRYRCFDKLRT